MSTIGIAIPCYEPHHNLLYRLFDSIAAQTRKPDRIVVSCSSWKIDTRKEHVYNGIPITIVYAKRNIVQAENRNIAARLLNTDIISFIDADDVMHPRRLEYILRGFQETKCDAIVHNYQHVHRSTQTPYEAEDELVFSPYPIVKNPDQPGCMSAGDVPFHHAHISVTRGVFARFQYPIEHRYYRIEDSVYVATLFANEVDIRHIANKLSQYMY